MHFHLKGRRLPFRDHMPMVSLTTRRCHQQAQQKAATTLGADERPGQIGKKTGTTSNVARIFRIESPACEFLEPQAYLHSSLNLWRKRKNRDPQPTTLQTPQSCIPRTLDKHIAGIPQIHSLPFVAGRTPAPPFVPEALDPEPPEVLLALPIEVQTPKPYQM